MHACVYVLCRYICLYMYYVWICIRVYASVCVCMHICVYVYVCAYMYMRLCVCMCTAVSRTKRLGHHCPSEWQSCLTWGAYYSSPENLWQCPLWPNKGICLGLYWQLPWFLETLPARHFYFLFFWHFYFLRRNLTSQMRAVIQKDQN